MIAGSLIAVGLVSNTVVRHLIQIAPVLGALLLSVRRPAVGGTAAAPLFAFWLLVMIAIWLFLLGIAQIVAGRFSRPEVALTLVIGVASTAGLTSTAGGASALSYPARVSTVLVFAAFQFAAMWLSTQPFAAGR